MRAGSTLFSYGLVVLCNHVCECYLRPAPHLASSRMYGTSRMGANVVNCHPICGRAG